jgi:hypothetical protein
MENARLFTETREALEQQTASAEVLRVINSSPGDLAPVFDAILQRAHSLCGVAYGSLQVYDGEKFRAVAVHRFAGAVGELAATGLPAQPRFLRTARSRRVCAHRRCDRHGSPAARRTAELSAIRTTLHVALHDGETLLGQIVAARTEVRPLSNREILFLKNFAAQAVIAMKNDLQSCFAASFSSVRCWSSSSGREDSDLATSTRMSARSP